MPENESYMCPHDTTESQRLETQHLFLTALAHNNLLHPSIPSHNLHTIADVGAGTVIWLRDVARDFRQRRHDDNAEFVAFDISGQLFHQTAERQELDLVLRDMTTPFPKEYHGYFDLANVRLLSYALRAEDLDKAVENVVQIIRPGGYLQWQEADITDAWATPETPAARDLVSYIREERMARGLTPCIVTPLIKRIQALPLRPFLTPGQLNSISWTDDLMRLIHLDTLSTATNPSPLVKVEQTRHVLTAASTLLEAGATRREKQANAPEVAQVEREELLRSAEAMMAMVKQIGIGEGPACSRWDGVLTFLVARKAVVVEGSGEWMSKRHEGGGV